MAKYSNLIVLPTLNEAGNIERIIAEIMSLETESDVLVIDDGSADGTEALVHCLCAKYPSLSLMQRGARLGVGSAHITAIRHARSKGYDVLVTMDADFSHRPADIPRFLDAVRSSDIVIGTRFARPDSLDEWNMFRKSVTHLGHFLTWLFLSLPYDASGAFRAYRLGRIPRDLIDNLESQDYAFFFESLTLMHRRGLSINELPIVLPARTYGSSKMQIKHMVGGLYRLVRLALRLRLKASTACEVGNERPERIEN